VEGRRVANFLPQSLLVARCKRTGEKPLCHACTIYYNLVFSVAWIIHNHSKHFQTVLDTQRIQMSAALYLKLTQDSTVKNLSIARSAWMLSNTRASASVDQNTVHKLGVECSFYQCVDLLAFVPFNVCYSTDLLRCLVFFCGYLQCENSWSELSLCARLKPGFVFCSHHPHMSRINQYDASMKSAYPSPFIFQPMLSG
jgi:hypothetical protein